MEKEELCLETDSLSNGDVLTSGSAFCKLIFGQCAQEVTRLFSRQLQKGGEVRLGPGFRPLLGTRQLLSEVRGRKFKTKTRLLEKS